MALSDIYKSPLYIDSTNSRVGIGTTSANKSSSSTALTVNTSSAGNYSALELSSGDTLNWYINSNNTAVYDVTAGTRPRIFYTNGAERMRIDSNGTIMTGKTVENTSTDGIELNRNNVLVATRNNDAPLILNRRSSDGEIAVFRKDNTTVGSIGARQSDLTIGTGTVGLQFYNVGSEIFPVNISTNTFTDGTVTLGDALVRFNNLYLSGGVYLGGTGSANYLDDFEEGEYEATLTTEVSGTITLSSFHHDLRYTKIGSRVFVSGKVDVSSVSSPVGFVRLNLPFVVVQTGTLNDSRRFNGTIWVRNAGVNMDQFLLYGIEGEGSVRIYRVSGANPASDAAQQFSGDEGVTVNFSYITN